MLKYAGFAMKYTLIFIMILAVSGNSFSQSVMVQPDSFQLQGVNINSGCTTADRGKVVFNTKINEMLYCNGTTWIDPESGTVVRVVPAFSASNISGQTLTAAFEKIEFPDKDFDADDNFNLQDAETHPNIFIAPANGYYQIYIKGILSFTNFVPTSTTTVEVGLVRVSDNTTFYDYAMFPISVFSNRETIRISKLVKLAAGTRAHFVMHIVNPPNSGSLKLYAINYSGHLVSWY